MLRSNTLESIEATNRKPSGLNLFHVVSQTVNSTIFKWKNNFPSPIMKITRKSVPSKFSTFSIDLPSKMEKQKCNGKITWIARFYSWANLETTTTPFYRLDVRWMNNPRRPTVLKSSWSRMRENFMANLLLHSSSKNGHYFEQSYRFSNGLIFLW